MMSIILKNDGRQFSTGGKIFTRRRWWDADMTFRVNRNYWFLGFLFNANTLRAT
jgi:hypothetical protein